MTKGGLKRKASQQLTRSTTEEEPPEDTHNMQSLQATLSRFCNFCLSFFVNTPMEMSKESHDVSSDDRVIQTYESATIPRTEKRAPRSNATRSKSVVDRHRKAGRGVIDITKCKDEEEARARIDKFWLPPELGFSKSVTEPAKPPLTPDSSREDLNQGRRYSDPLLSPRASAGSSASPDYGSNQRGFASSRSLGRAPGTPESLPRDDFRSQNSRKGGLIDALESLFLHEKEGGPKPSETKEKERERARELRRIEQERAARQAAKDRRLYRQYPAKALVAPLNSKWDNLVSEAQGAYGDKTITTSLEGTELRPKDFSTLLGRHAWLNDEIINTYIEWVVVAANEAAAAEAKAWGEKPSTVPKFIAHNSFFYMNLRNKGPASTDRLMKRKKAPGPSLLEVDSVFVPICQGSHWTIGVVRPVAKTIEYFDSMGGSPTEFVRQMRGWLKHQLGPKYKEDEWTTPRTACARQTNGYDCGVFVCTNAFCVALGIDTSCYEERDMTLQRRCIAAILINRGFTKDFEWGKGGLLT